MSWSLYDFHMEEHEPSPQPIINALNGFCGPLTQLGFYPEWALGLLHTLSCMSCATLPITRAENDPDLSQEKEKEREGDSARRDGVNENQTSYLGVKEKGNFVPMSPDAESSNVGLAT